jgi:hypothetical protein
MVINERVKLLADLVEAAQKYRCIIPDATKLIILNDSDNMKVLKTNEYIRLPNSYVEDLLEKRKVVN